MRGILKVAAFLATSLPIALVLALAFNGVPKPPAITAEGVGRVGWQPVLDDASQRVSNFVTFLENTADYRRDARRAEYGDERIPEMREFLESIAPLNNAERITSRLMVVQGANDPRVPVGESRQLVERVRANGLEVAYMEGANEGHGFRHPWNSFYAGLAQREMTRECLLAD